MAQPLQPQPAQAQRLHDLVFAGTPGAAAADRTAAPRVDGDRAALPGRPAAPEVPA
jgi:hypothetical protein